MGETYYDVLGVDPDASRGEITAAYRERVLETHPDRSDDPDAAATFDLVTTARDVLVDADERARYDRLGHEAYQRLQTGGVAGGGSGRSSSRARSSASGTRARSDRASAGGRSSTGAKPDVREHPPRATRATTPASGPTDAGHDTKTGLEPPTGLGARNPLDRPAGSPNKRAGHERGGRRRTPTRLVGLTGVRLVVETPRLMAFATPSTTGTTTLTSPASTKNSGIRLPSWSPA